MSIGIDIVNIARIEKLLEKNGSKFLTKFFSANEIKNGKKLKGRKFTAYYAKRFAAKEAVSKVFGTGIGKNISFKDISIENEKSGKPIVVLSAKAKKLLPKNAKLEISLSDDLTINAAVAIALLFPGHPAAR